MSARWRGVFAATAVMLCGVGALAACGGTVESKTSETSDAGREGSATFDASLADVDAQPAPPGEASADACSGACADASSDASVLPIDAGTPTEAAIDGDTDAAQSGDTDADAAPFEAGLDAGLDAPAATERCHVEWPQPSGLSVSSSGVQLVADRAGGAYLIVTHGEPSPFAAMTGPLPAIDFGVTAPGYQTGVAIVKLDAQCTVVWVREIGTGTFSNSTDITSSGVGVDSRSNLTVMGAFMGSVDLGAGIVESTADASTWSFDGFVLRFDPDGNVLQRTVLRSDGPFGMLPTALAVSPSGESTLLVSAGINVDLGDAPDASVAANGTTLVRYLVNLAPDGGVVSQTPLATGSLSALPQQPFSQIAIDPGGTPWAIGDDGNGQRVMRLSLSDGIDWQQPTGGNVALAAGPGGAVVLDTSTTTPQVETLLGGGSDGGDAAPFTQTFSPQLGPVQSQQVALDADGGVVILGPIPGVAPMIDAGVWGIPNPTELGFVAFDPTGVPLWEGAWVNAIEQRFGQGTIAAGGDVLIAGTTVSPSGGTGSVLVARFER